MIYHITTLADWESRPTQGDFYSKDFDREKFIHCSTHAQLAGVLDRYFKNQTNLVLIHLDEKQLRAELRYEPATNNEMFPHLYGGINPEAVIKVEKL